MVALLRREVTPSFTVCNELQFADGNAARHPYGGGVIRFIAAVVLSLPVFASVRADDGKFEGFKAHAAAQHGEAGARAAAFLLEHMPEVDREALDSAFLIHHLDGAFAARAEFPWARNVPEEIFLNDVLPYAVFDETRETWRGDFLAKGRGLVKDARTATDAAQALNRGFFDLIQVHYDTGRKAPNQSPSESIASGKATCTGLTILLVNACRAVGVPARAAGTPLWANGRGNHTWAEIWDGRWHFTGADEYDAAGLDRAWFVADAAKADDRHPIFATSWKRGDIHFPMVWARRDRSVAAVDVTDRYAGGKQDGLAELGIRLFETAGGARVSADAIAVDETGRIILRAETRSGRADANDMPRLRIPPGGKGFVFLTMNDGTRMAEYGPLAGPVTTLDAAWDSLPPVSEGIRDLLRWLRAKPKDRGDLAELLRTPLGAGDVAPATALLAADAFRAEMADREAEMAAREIRHGDKTMKWNERVFGETPADGRSLWISMHGGGGAPAEVNDSQWRNQLDLYQPAEGIYIAPRAPTDNWNLWHEAHIDPMFQRLIENHAILRGVNPDKVYLLGYSAGGDGVWQLAPRMADRFAAASMMAGHPNEATLDGLRNLPFGIFMGAEDAAYDRNKIAAERAAEIARLATADPGGYRHMVRIYQGLGHWMERKDAEALPWMAEFRREAWPRRIVWKQDDVTHDRFYWLRIPDKAAAKAGDKIVAEVKDGKIVLEGDVPAGTEIRLSDRLLNLDQEIEISVNGRPFRTKPVRRAETIRRTLLERADPAAAASAIVDCGP